MEKSPSPVYGARLELVYGLIAHRGFESLLLRHKSTVILIELRWTFSIPENRLESGFPAVRAHKRTGICRLSGKEYQIMELLMRNPGRLISTELFLEKVWGYDAESDISVVWVYLSNLRKKMASIGTNVQIKATRGAGYLLEEIT